MKKIRETELRFVYKDTEYYAPDEINEARDAAKLFEDVFDMSAQAQEIFCALFLDEERHVVGIEKVSMGDVKSVQSSTHELFKRGLLHNASRVIVAHNHLSDTPNPSFDDVELTWNLVHSGMFIGIQLDDHIVISNGEFYSIGVAFQMEEYSPEDDYSGEQLQDVFQKLEKDNFPPFKI